MNEFRDYWTGLAPEEKRELAERVGVSLRYLSHIAHGHRNAGAKVLMRIGKATEGRVTSSVLRPDLAQ